MAAFADTAVCHCQDFCEVLGVAIVSTPQKREAFAGCLEQGWSTLFSQSGGSLVLAGDRENSAGVVGAKSGDYVSAETKASSCIGKVGALAEEGAVDVEGLVFGVSIEDGILDERSSLPFAQFP